MVRWPSLFSRSDRAEPPTRPSRTLFFWLVGAFVLTLVPHIDLLPVWVTVVVAIAMIVRCFHELYRFPLPTTTTTALLAIGFLAAIFRQYETIVGREAGTAFMAGLLAIKFYELRGPRDAAMVIFSSIFIVMSALLYSQALELFIYCLIMMWLLTATLLRTSMGDLADHHLLQMLRLASVIFIQALPLAVIFFFFLPRYSGKFQMVLTDAPLGLTDKVEPGSISRLADNDSPAMYVKFLSNGDIPSIDTMYWRAVTLWDYHHGAWTQGSMGFLIDVPLPLPAPDCKPLDQEITIWPHNQKWLFALDYPVSPAVNPSENGLWSTTLYGGILQLRAWTAKLDHKERYTVTSSTLLAEQELTPLEQRVGIQLPAPGANDAIDPRVRQLADQLHRQNPDPKSYVLSILHYFRHEHFTYTVAPGAVTQDWLPNFLFEKKAGFCEHYAAAFAVLMRLEGIPSRLVIGYQGGEFNPYDNLYTVRQSNAHAWDEVWIDAKVQPLKKEMGHWMRVDPTAILPLGDESQLASNNPDKADDSFSMQVAHHRLSFSQTYLPDWLNKTMDDLQLRRQQVEANWDDWVFSYDPEAQNRLAEALGLGKGALLLACLVATGICVVVFQKLMKRRVIVTPVEQLYAAFCRIMAQRGIPRAKWEGPLAYTERVAEDFPDKKEAIHDVGLIIAEARYGASPPDPCAPKELQSLLNDITKSLAASSLNERP